MSGARRNLDCRRNLGDRYPSSAGSPRCQAGHAIKNTAEFAKALKDLDLGGKLLTVGILLIAIAAITAGLDNVTEAIESAV
jgi:hypothetical protein